MLSGQANFLQSLGWALLNNLWQMALLWLIFQLITSITKSASSSFRSSLASFLLIMGFCFFIYTFFSFYLNTSEQGIIVFSLLQNEENISSVNWMQKSLTMASGLYLLLLVIPVAHFIRNYRYVGVIRKYGLSKVDVQWRIFIKKVADRLGINKPVQIWVSEFVSSPVTIGFLKPVILVPLAAINNLSPQQMEAVLLHELSHIKRYDYLVNLVINFIQTILYFNPFVKVFVKIVEREREKSCDEMVLQFQYDSHEYASALLTLEKTNHIYRPLAVGATGKKNDLLKRVELIMGVKTKKSISFNKIAGFFAGLICIIMLNVLLFMDQPSGVKTQDNFASLSSPFHFMANTLSETEETPVITKTNPELISNTGNDVKMSPVSESPPSPPIPDADGIINVSFTQPIVLQLKKYEEAQVKAAMDASKKILENEEWKALELNIADVFTQKQKEELKISYRKALDKMDWNKWENKLRLAYDKVDWNQVNEQLAKAVNNIRIDSLQNVYNDAICQLETTKKELTQNHLPGIPDTDITLKTIEETKQQVQKTLSRLKAVRNKKIVHL